MARDVSQEERVIERVRKLMALSKSSNEHEAAAAAAKAQELLLKYNLSVTSLEEPVEPDVIQSLYTEKYGLGWRNTLMNSVGRATGCRIVMSSSYATTQAKTYHIFGKPSNIEVAVYLYEYLARELVRISPKPFRSAASNAFCLGAVSTINTRLMLTYREFTEATVDTHALIVVQDAAVAAKVNEAFPKRGTSRGARASDLDAYNQGRKAGESVSLRRGVNSTNAAGQALLK